MEFGWSVLGGQIGIWVREQIGIWVCERSAEVYGRSDGWWLWRSSLGLLVLMLIGLYGK